MREFRTYGSVRGAHGNGRPYRYHSLLVSETEPAGRRSRMTQEQKIIRAKLGLLELAKQLGNSLPPRKRGSAKPAR